MISAAISVSIMSKPVIAVDGPAASGKGTVARKLAEALNFAYMDTGILYRAVAFEVIDDGLSVKDKRDCMDAAKILIKKIKNSPNPSKITGNPRLRDDDIGQAASKVAAIGEVRETLNDLQRQFAKRRLKELQSKGIAATYGTVLDDMRERDSRDAQRKDAPMTRAKDAIIIDNSDLNADETLEMALKITKERLNL